MTENNKNKYNENQLRIAEKIAAYIKGELDIKELSEWLKTSDNNRKLFDYLTDPYTISSKLSYNQLGIDEVQKARAWHKISTNHIDRNIRKKIVNWRLISVTVAACVVVAFITNYFTREQIFQQQRELIAGVTDRKSLETHGTQLIMSDSTVIDLEKTQDFIISERGGALIRKKSDMVDYSAINEGMKREKLIYNKIEVPPGTDFKFRLSDGTLVYLNASSSLRFPVNFTSGRRDVELDGEAYF